MNGSATLGKKRIRRSLTIGLLRLPPGLASRASPPFSSMEVYGSYPRHMQPIECPAAAETQQTLAAGRGQATRVAAQSPSVSLLPIDHATRMEQWDLIASKSTSFMQTTKIGVLAKLFLTT
jgi:hypothetical protein